MTWAPDYIAVSDLKAFLRIDSGDTADDVQLARDVTAASRAVDMTCSAGFPRQFGQTTGTETRYYTPRYDCSRGRWVIETDDFQDATGLTVTITNSVVTAAAVTLYAKQPINGAATGRPYTRLVVDRLSTVVPRGEENEAAVTAKWGWAAVPVPVAEATLLQAARFTKRRDAPFGIAGSPDSGSEVRLLAKVDPDVAVSLRKYIRHRLTVG